MGAEWQSAPLDALVEEILDRRGVTPLKLGSDFVSTGHRVISAKLIKERRIDFGADAPRFVDAPTYAKWMRSPLLPDDVIMTSEAPLGQLAYISTRHDWCLGQRLFGIRTRKDRLHGRFLFYALQFDPVVGDLQARATGTTVLGIRQTELRRVQIPVPPLSEQRAIARILGALDDKIELNRRTNATLEAMARALFKSWFVDEPEPDWVTAPLAEWVDVLSGGTPPKANPALWGGSLKWISPKAMGSIHADECDDHVTELAIGNGTRLAPKGATLVMVRGMGLHDGVRVSQAREPVTFNQDVKALVAKNIEPDLLLFAMLDAQMELHTRVEPSGHGTGKLPSEILLAHPITMPPREVQRERVVHISALNDRIAANRSESRTLARLRDELLPRLLSGELSVAHAERAVEEVA